MFPIVPVLKNFQRVAAIFVIIAATLVCYWPAQDNGFVWDDTALVQRDPLIRSWRLIPEGFRHFLFLDATGSNFYRPLQRLTYVGDYALWGMHERGYHLTSIYWHGLAAIALFFLAERWLGEKRRWWAAGLALLWAIHPVHTSAVTYVSGRADSLAAFFGFTALTLGWMSLEKPEQRRWAMPLAALGFLAAVLSKESGAMAIVVWLAILLARKAGSAVIGRWAVVAVVVFGIYCGLRFTAHKVAPPESSARPWGERVVVGARAVAEYAELMVAPVTLRMERDVSDPKGADAERVGRLKAQTVAGGVLIAGLIGWGLWARRRAPEAALALLAGAIAYLPVSNLMGLNATVAEHWIHVPSAFLLMAVAATWQRFAPVWLAVALVPWVGWLGVRTWQRQFDWKDQRTFLTRTIEAGGDSARMRVQLGNLELNEGRLEEAERQFRLALERSPDLPFAHLGMTALAMRRNDFAAARASLDRVKEHRVVTVAAKQMEASLDFRERRKDPLPVLKEVAAQEPLYWPAQRRYIEALDLAGRTVDAVRELREYVAKQPFRAESWALLGHLLGKVRQTDAAIASFEEAMWRDVRDYESRHRREILLRIKDGAVE